jgi:hypothetical protein
MVTEPAPLYRGAWDVWAHVFRCRKCYPLRGATLHFARGVFNHQQMDYFQEFSLASVLPSRPPQTTQDFSTLCLCDRGSECNVLYVVILVWRAVGDRRPQTPP